MAHTFLKWMQGILSVKLVGPSPERFVNLCRSKNITIYRISCQKKKYTFCISVSEYKKLKPVVKKTKTFPKIINKQGFPFFLNHWKQKQGFLLGIFLFFGLLVFMSKLVWTIDIQGEYTHTKEELLKFLNKNEIHSFVFLKDINCLHIEEDIRKKYKDIGWVSAQLNGTKLLVRIKETNMPSLYQKKSIPVHLVSKRDGIISSIVTRTGHPLVKMGDEVKTDDILISGVVDIIGDNDLLLRKHPCIADGEIILKTEYKYENNRNFSYLEKKYTKREQQGFAIQIKEKRLEIFPPSFTRKKWKNISTLVEKKQYNQLSFDKIKKFEYENKPKKYTMEEAQNYLNIKFKRYIKKITEKGVIIQENNVKIDKIGEKLQAKGTLTVLEPVKSYRKILDSEWRDTEGNEYSRSKS